MTAKLRWGLLSTAQINNALIGPIRHAARSELVAVASRSQEKAKAYAKANNIPKAHGSYEALLADPEVDVIYNSLPNTVHCEWTVKAANAGKHVLCEKPITTTLSELDKIEKATKTNQVIIFEAFMYLHHPQTRVVKEIIQAGQLGNLQLVSSWYAYYFPPEDKQNIRLNPTLAGGALWDVGVYPNSLAIVLAQAGPPVEVWASQIKGESGVDVAMTAQMKFANGVEAQIASSFLSPFPAGAQITGSEGMIQISEAWKPGLGWQKDTELILSRIGGAKETIIVPAVDPYFCEVEAMEACVLDGAEPVVPLSLSRDFLRSILALYESANSGQPVRL
jgi:xylose dehydrogenase (NAD/NADP)